ncbi:Holliday junction resolvase RuvX [Janibacter anophelis]|uniref:Holliday junction resolvase RuvX n=1 Tax=Janibacter anophelis TaxID=319054 RepID=UPI000B0FDB29|nr:Holliday junction resolvase RuvX [Janibacter anophelis]
MTEAAGSVRPGVRIGVDVGDARVGVASSDPSGLLATPVETVARDVEHNSDVDRVVEIATELEAVEVVVGLPRSLDGSEGPAAAKAREWAAHLRSALGRAPIGNTPIRLVDERLTTVDAHRGLRDSGLAGRRHRGVVDQAAAVLILQTALDTERATGGPPGERVGRPRRRTPRKGKDA